VSGYASEAYARSFAPVAEPLALPRSGGWLLQRAVPGSTARDAMGCYPFFACRDWAALPDDLRELPAELLSVAIVADPFGAHTPELLAVCFPDRLLALKDHYVADLRMEPACFVTKHHQRYASKALRTLEITRCADPPAQLDVWCALYGRLVERHAITGLRAFSREQFAAQLRVPGLHLFQARQSDQVVAMSLWMETGEVAYYHLGAAGPAGYAQQASFGLFWKALEHFRAAGLRWAALGGGAGLTAHDDGLTRFKAGWATGVRRAYFCGRVINRAGYQTLAAERDHGPPDYFPAYRAGEFG
jgi:hypothetical protein